MKVDLKGKGIKELDFSSHDPAAADSKEVFALQSIDTIDASDNDIRLLKKLDVFPNLKTLVLKKNKLSSPISFFVRHLPWGTLTSLDLSHNEITCLEGGKSCSYGWQHDDEEEMEILRQRESGMDPRNAEEDLLRLRVNFRSLVALRELNLSFNNITVTVPAGGAGPGSPPQPLLGSALVVLDVSYNSITTLQPIIEGLTGLESLNAEGNKIEDIEQGGVVSLASTCLLLRHLFLDGNPLVQVLGHGYRHAVINTFKLAAQAAGEPASSLEVLDGIPLTNAAIATESAASAHPPAAGGGFALDGNDGAPTSKRGGSAAAAGGGGGLNLASEVTAQLKRQQQQVQQVVADVSFQSEESEVQPVDISEHVAVLPARTRVVSDSKPASTHDADHGPPARQQQQQRGGAIRQPSATASSSSLSRDFGSPISDPSSEGDDGDGYQEDSDAWMSPPEQFKYKDSPSYDVVEDENDFKPSTSRHHRGPTSGSDSRSTSNTTSVVSNGNASTRQWKEQRRAHRGAAAEQERSGQRPGNTYKSLLHKPGALSPPQSSSVTTRPPRGPSASRGARVPYDEHCEEDGYGYDDAGDYESGGQDGNTSIGRQLLDQEEAALKSCFPAVEINQRREAVRKAATSAMKSAMKSGDSHRRKELTRMAELQKLSVLLERSLQDTQESIQTIGRSNTALERKLSDSRNAISDQLKEAAALKAERATLLSTISTLEMSRQKAEYEIQHAERALEHEEVKSVRRTREVEESRIAMQRAKSAEKRRKEVLARRALNAPPPRMTNSAVKRQETTRRKLAEIDENSSYFNRQDQLPMPEGYYNDDVLLMDGPSPYDIVGAVPLAPQPYSTSSPRRYQTPQGVGSSSTPRRTRSATRRNGNSPPGVEAEEGYEYTDDGSNYFKLREDHVEGDSSFERSRPPPHVRPSSSASVRSDGSTNHATRSRVQIGRPQPSQSERSSINVSNSTIDSAHLILASEDDEPSTAVPILR